MLQLSRISYCQNQCFQHLCVFHSAPSSFKLCVPCICVLTDSLLVPMPPTPLALSHSIPVVNSVVDADVRRQPKGLLLNTKGKRKETACQSPAKMCGAAGGSCDRAALSQGGFSTPSWVGSQRSCLKPSRWAWSSVAPGRTSWLAGTRE